MSDYTQSVYFAPKDALSSGDPLKKIKGSEVDAELLAISTAIATKENTSSKGAANGYCGLDAGGLVLASDLPATVVYSNAAVSLSSTLAVTGATTLTGNLTVNTNKFTVTAASGNTSVAGTLGVTGTATLGALIVTGATSVAGLAATSITLTGAMTISTTLGVSGTLTGAGASFTSLTVGGSNVLTSASSITESQITDSTLLARVADNEAVTGAWTFSSTLKKASKGHFLYYDSATQAAGAITVSTLDASGTPAAGDLWFKYTA